MREIVRGEIAFDPEFEGKLRGGYYSPVHIVEVDKLESGVWVSRKAVMKQWGKAPDIRDDCGSFQTMAEVELVMSDMEWLRTQVSSAGVNVPNFYFWEVVDERLSWLDAIKSLSGERVLPSEGLRVVGLEEYSGTVLRDLVPEVRPGAIALARASLKMIPEGLAIDAHPGNFTWDGTGVTFVDFVPPKIWEYRGVGRMEEIFPTIKKRDDDNMKKYYYLTAKGRLERFDYYVSKFSL